MSAKRRGRLTLADDKRGQAYTLEGVVSAIVVASALIIGLQAVDPAPWTDQDGIDTEEHRVLVSDLLEASSERQSMTATDDLTRAVTCLSDNNPNEAAFESDGIVGENIHQLLANQSGVNYQVFLDYTTENGDKEEIEVYSTAESPTSSSVTVTRQVPVYDNTPVHRGDECLRDDDDKIGDEDVDFYADERAGSGELYAFVTVRVVVW